MSDVGVKQDWRVVCSFESDVFTSRASDRRARRNWNVANDTLESVRTLTGVRRFGLMTGCAVLTRRWTTLIDQLLNNRELLIKLFTQNNKEVFKTEVTTRVRNFRDVAPFCISNFPVLQKNFRLFCRL